MKLGLAFLLAGSLAACSSSAPVNRAIEPLVTIHQGLYGQTTYYDDVGNNQPEVNSMTFTATRASDGHVTSATSDSEHGFYQMELDAGDYQLCTTFQRCTAVTVVAGARLRKDYEMGPGSGWD